MHAVGRGGFCTGCGASHAPSQRFCHTCGDPLDDDAPSDPRVGANLGRYKIERVIASGGMGIVYAARDPKLGRTVALKLLREDLAADDEFRKRFVRESRAAASLDHPNILPVFDAGEVDGVLYIATRLVDALDLRQLLAHEGELSLERTLLIAAQVAAALDFAHENGTIHRDVKPANLLVVPGRDGDADHAYLIDFGITKHAALDHTLTSSGLFVGTPEYVAPEQAAGTALDGRADQYALACVVHHCLSGAPPFSSANPIDVLHAHLYAEPTPLGDVRTDLPDSVESAVLRALSKDPEQRFATCRAFIAAARAGTGLPAPLTPRPGPTVALTARPARPGPPPVPKPASAGDARRRALAMGAVVIVALAVTGAGAGALIGSGGSDTKDLADTSTQTTTGRTSAQPTTDPRPLTTSTPAPPPVQPPFSFSVDDLRLESMQQDGFSIDLPSDWRVIRDDERQISPDTVTRKRTEVAAQDGRLSIVVDHLTGYDVPPEENRANIVSSDGDHRPGHRTIDLDDYDLNDTRIYEYRYRFVSKAGREARRVDLLFRKGDHDFAVEAGGNAEYDDLAALARAAAETVTVDEEEPTPLATEPDYGTYTGIVLQRGSVNDDFTVSMEFGSSGVTIAYPDTGCSGTLAYEDRDEDAVEYSENIEQGTCSRGGTWLIDASGSVIKVKWSAPDRRYTIKGELSSDG